MPAKASSRQIRQQRVERTRRLPGPTDAEPEADSYFDPFNRLVDDLLDEARRSFGEAIKRLEVALAGRYDLFPAELDEEGVRLCDEIKASELAIIDCNRRYCELGLDQFNQFTSPSLRRRVAGATAQLEALIPMLTCHTARLNAFLDSVPQRLLN